MTTYFGTFFFFFNVILKVQEFTSLIMLKAKLGYLSQDKLGLNIRLKAKLTSKTLNDISKLHLIN